MLSYYGQNTVFFHFRLLIQAQQNVWKNLWYFSVKKKTFCCFKWLYKVMAYEDTAILNFVYTAR